MTDLSRTNQDLFEEISLLKQRIKELEQAESDLSQSEEKYRRTLDSMIEGCQIIGFDWRYLYVNDSVARQGRQTKKDLLGRTMMECYPGFEDTEIYAVLKQCMEDRTGRTMENDFYYPDGDKGFFELSIQPVPDGVFVLSIDITERKRSEENARHLNAILNAILNVNQLITKEKDKTLLLQGVCEEMVATTGFNAAWIITLDQTERPVSMWEAGLRESSPVLKEMVERGEIPLCAKTALARPGLVIVKDTFDQCAGCPLGQDYMENASFCIRLEKDGKIYGILCGNLPHAFDDDTKEQSLFQEIGEDIAFGLYNMEQEERRARMEKELKDSEARYRTLFENIPEGVLIVETATRRFKYVNPAMCRMLQYTEDELKQLTTNDIHPPDLLERISSEFMQNEQKNKSMTQQDIACLKKDGTIIYTDVITAPRVFMDGSFHSATFFIDITKRKNEEEKKKKLEEQLAQARKMEAIGRLSGGIAHDFNNMLTTILGNAEIALKEAGEKALLRDAIEDIRIAGEKAAILTRQLLTFSRKQIFMTRIFNLNDIMTEVNRLLLRLIGEDVELSMRLSPDPCMVEADPGQMEQIILNLTVNARDAMPLGGRLTIETASVEFDEEYVYSHTSVLPGHYEMISISDTGVGMTKEVQSQLFEPFFTTKPKGKGTGFGLSTVYGIVKQSNGYIWVYSEEGKGTTFKIYLPSVKKADHVLTNEDKKSQEISRGSETILVVEDDPMIMKLTVKVLTNSGYTVLRAGDGNEALRVSDEHKGPIHLLLTDVIMPGMGGRELANRFQVIRPKTKILFMSGYTDDAISNHGVLEKGLFLIQKPFTSNLLQKTIRELLGDEPQGIS